MTHALQQKDGLDMNAVLALQGLQESAGSAEGLAVTTIGSFISRFSECSSSCQIA